MSDFAALDARLLEMSGRLESLTIEMTKVKVKLDQSLKGTIEASRLRWGAREIRYVFFSVVIPILISAMATYYGIKSQVDNISQVLQTHITHEQKLKR